MFKFLKRWRAKQQPKKVLLDKAKHYAYSLDLKQFKFAKGQFLVPPFVMDLVSTKDVLAGKAYPLDQIIKVGNEVLGEGVLEIL